MTQSLIPEDREPENLDVKYQIIQPEAPYNNYGERGYVDLYIRREYPRSLEDHIYELKANLENFQPSEITRQTTRMVENFYGDDARQIPDKHRFELSIIPTLDNVLYLRENWPIFLNFAKSYNNLIFTFRHPKNTCPVHLVASAFEFLDKDWIEYCERTNPKVFGVISDVIDFE